MVSANAFILPEVRTFYDILIDCPNDQISGQITVPTEEIAKITARSLRAQGYIVTIRKFTESKTLNWEYLE